MCSLLKLLILKFVKNVKVNMVMRQHNIWFECTCFLCEDVCRSADSSCINLNAYRWQAGWQNISEAEWQKAFYEFNLLLISSRI